MNLHIIRSAGFTAAVDTFAPDGEQLWFISTLESQSLRGRMRRSPGPAREGHRSGRLDVHEHRFAFIIFWVP